MNQFLLAFITGLTTGGISCFAVQGGLLTSALVTDEEINISKNLKAKSLVAFLLAKLIAYTLLGFLLGLLGSKLIVTPRVQGWLQIVIGIYMLIMAANLMNLHPFFKRFILRPPKFIFRFLRKVSISGSLLTPIFLGLLTILIPCGITQGMMLLAVSAGNPIFSAGIIFAFILGTSPVFFVIGMAATELFKRKAFAVIAALVVAIMGIVSINSGQVLRGSAQTLQNYWAVLTGSNSIAQAGSVVSGVQNITINVTNSGYKTNINTIKLGTPVKLTLVTNNVTTCAKAFSIPNYNIFKMLPQNGTETIEFTPTKTGLLTYTCSMGMYSGSFNVIE